MSVDSRSQGAAASLSTRATEQSYPEELKATLGVLSEDALTLLQQHLELAKVELKSELKELVEASGWVIGTIAVFFCAALALIAAAVLALSLAMPGWASALIVAAVLMGGGIVVGFIARREAADVDGVSDETTPDPLPARPRMGGRA